GAGRPPGGVYDRGRPSADRANAGAQEGGGRLSYTPPGQQRGYAKFFEQRAGTRAGRLRQAQEKRQIDRMVDINGDSGLTDHRRLDALQTRGVEVREVTVIAEAKRHRFRR